jgi:thioredoxin-related protein
MKLLIFCFAVLLFVNFALSHEREKFDPKRDAAKDIQNAVSEAKKNDKRILLDVGGEWCIWCHRLDEFFAGNKDIQDLLKKNFVIVKVNYSPENKNEKVLGKYPEISGYPHIFILNTDGKLIHSQNTGELEKDKGYDRDKVISFLKKWSANRK